MSIVNLDKLDCDSGWTSSELGAIELGKRRLNKRLLLTTEALSAMPLSPINQASKDWASTKAAYRLFANEKVCSDSILSVHQANTVYRALKEEVVLAIQDTSYLNYSNHDSCRGLVKKVH